MITKRPAANGQICDVIFEFTALSGAQQISLCGDFNGWSRTATPLRRCDTERFAVTLSLHTGRSYRFRYLLDNERWENDWNADDYQPNGHGGADSVIRV